MKQILILLLVISLTWVSIVLCGIIFYEVSYAISAEYFTRNLFISYGYCGYLTCVPENAESLVAYIGFDATWWRALIASTLLALLAVILGTTWEIFRATLWALNRIIITTTVSAVVGLSAGYLYLDVAKNGAKIPANLKLPKDYLAVDTMQYFAFLGGILGLVFGAVYLIRRRKKLGRDSGEYRLFNTDQAVNEVDPD